MTSNEEAQLAQTIEMFEVITASQPLDYQSLEILKEAYIKLERQKDVVSTSKKIAQAYVQLGQLSSAILEYESILQRYPDDPDVQSALQEIESKASNFGGAPVAEEVVAPTDDAGARGGTAGQTAGSEVDDGRNVMEKLFVDGRLISASDFNLHWRVPADNDSSQGVAQPFIQILADKGMVPLDRSLKLLCERSRIPFVPVESYDVDVELARSFPREVCLRWCVLPFDRMSKSVLVATANPFNRQVAWELENSTHSRLLWYLSPPDELSRLIRKVFR